MTSNEKEKMLRGEPYRWTDEVLTAEREHARHFFQQLNQSPPNDRDTYHEIREQLFPNAADDFWVSRRFTAITATTSTLVPTSSSISIA